MLYKRSSRYHIVDLTANFKLPEFLCPCGECEFQRLDLRLPIMLQKLRDKIKRPIVPTHRGGAYRCPTFNTSVGGSKTSKHMDGMAIDCAVVGMSGFEVVSAALEVGFMRAGVADRWCHLDVYPTEKVKIWVYPPLNLQDTVKRLEELHGITI